MINTLLNVLPLIATVFLVTCYIPQVVQTYKSKDVSSMNLGFWVMLNIALSCLLVNSILLAIQHGTWGYAVTYIFNESLAFTMLMMVLKYRKKVK